MKREFFPSKISSYVANSTQHNSQCLEFDRYLQLSWQIIHCLIQATAGKLELQSRQMTQDAAVSARSLLLCLCRGWELVMQS